MTDHDVPLQQYVLSLPTGVRASQLTAAEFYSQFGQAVATPPFYVVALGDLHPQPAANIEAGFAKRNEYAAWKLLSGPPRTVGSVLIFSMANGQPLVHVVPAGGGFVPEAAELGLVALVEAAFRYQPAHDWVLTALSLPLSDEAEDTLAGLGFESVYSPVFDAFGRVTFGIRREVFSAMHANSAPS